MSPSPARIRVLIVDDEALARKRVRRLLLSDPEIEIVGECATGEDAVQTVGEMSPDLLCLDVQMPGMDGFAVVEALAALGTPLPVIIFITAYDQYALKAFEVQAQDYLLKPFDRPRFYRAIRAAKEQVGRRQTAGTNRRLMDLLETLQTPQRYLSRLVVKNGGRILFLKVNDIDWIEAADNYVRLHCGADTHLLRETMNRLQEQLDPGRFLRIHRSTIVNVDRIEELQPWFHGDFLVKLRGGAELTLSRGYRERVEAALGRGL